MKIIVALLLVLPVLAVGGCQDEQPTPSATTRHPPSPQAAEVPPGAHLVAVKVRRTPDGLRVAAWWRVGNKETGTILSSGDDFATVHARAWTDAWYDVAAHEPEVPGFDGLLQQRVRSLVPGVRAVVAGGDGATLFPFQAVARSTDGAAGWTTYDVGRPGDAQPYSSGQVVLADGRVLVLLDRWSDDLDGRPGARPHGLYASQGDDWSRYRPVEPVFRPALRPDPRGWSPLDSLQASNDRGGVVWVTTTHGSVYASTDGARTFREIRTR